MKYLKHIITSLIGVLLILSSCDDKMPYPEAERVTWVTLENESGFSFTNPPLLTNMNVDTEFKFGVRLHKFGGADYEKVEVCAVRYPTQAANFKTLVMSEITSGLSVETKTMSTFKLSDILNTTGGPILSCESFGVYYNVFMANGARSTGWMPPPTLFTARFGLSNILQPDPANANYNPDDVGRFHNFTINVYCARTFANFLGDWTVRFAYFNQTWDAVVTEDPAKPGAGLIFTFQDNGAYPTPEPMKVGVQMRSGTNPNIRFEFARQTIYTGAVPEKNPDNPTWVDYRFGPSGTTPTAVNLNCCTMSLSISTAHVVNAGAEAPDYPLGAFAVALTKK